MLNSLITTFASVGVFFSLISTAFFVNWTLIEYVLLDKANHSIQSNARSMDQRDLYILATREDAHRMNVFACGTWSFLSVVIGVQCVGILSSNLSKNKKDPNK